MFRYSLTDIKNDGSIVVTDTVDNEDYSISKHELTEIYTYLNIPITENGYRYIMNEQQPNFGTYMNNQFIVEQNYGVYKVDSFTRQVVLLGEVGTIDLSSVRKLEIVFDDGGNVSCLKTDTCVENLSLTTESKSLIKVDLKDDFFSRCHNIFSNKHNLHVRVYANIIDLQYICCISSLEIISETIDCNNVIARFRMWKRLLMVDDTIVSIYNVDNLLDYMSTKEFYKLNGICVLCIKEDAVSDSLVKKYKKKLSVVKDNTGYIIQNGNAKRV